MALMFHFIVLSILTAYTIDVINNIGQVAVIEYGAVHQSWSPSNPSTIFANGVIKVCNMNNPIRIL